MLIVKIIHLKYFKSILRYRNDKSFKYGKVIIESYDKTLGYTVYEYRKPIIKERQEIILNYIIQYNKEPIDLLYLSNKLYVTKRTIQKILKYYKTIS